MVESLFICHTPLHTLIAEKIAEHKKLVNPTFVFFYETKSQTIEFYKNKISKKYKTFVIEKSNKFLMDFFNILFKIQKLIGKEYICHIGNIKSFHSRFILSLIKVKELNTFDDGSGNISGEGYFYNLTERLHSLIYFHLINKELFYRNIVQNIDTHYTIFKLPNVFKNAIFIDIFDLRNGNRNDEKNRYEKTVFISNAFCEDGLLSFEEEKYLIKEIDDKFNIDYVLKHPREKRHEKYDKNYININDGRISEEILIDLSRKYSLIIIGVFSTVLLNISNIGNSRLINIDFSKIKKPTSGLKDIFKKLGIQNYELH